MHRAISQSLGKSSEKNRVCEEKMSDTDDDDARSWRKFGKPEQMVFDSKKSRRARNEQPKFEKGVANFRNASKAEGACVNTPGCSSGFQILNKDPVLAWNLLPWYPWCDSLKSPNLFCTHSLAVLQISMEQKLYLDCRFSVALKRALLGIYVISKQLRKFSGRPWLSTTRASQSVRGCAHFRHSLCQNGHGWRFVEVGEKLTVLGDNN